MKSKIITIAFEGMHRVGKGTQIDLLAEYLNQFCVPHIKIKGDGSRSGIGTDSGDPYSGWWIKQNHKLRKTSGTENFEEWDKAAHRLVREFSIWKKRILPKLARGTSSEMGLLLIDRSIISRTSFVKYKFRFAINHHISGSKDLYPNISNELIDIALPDMIVELIAPKEILISRLDSDDPKYNFRFRMIEEMFDNYTSAKNHLPDEILRRVVSVDSTNSPEEVFQEILTHVSVKFPELIFLTN